MAPQKRPAAAAAGAAKRAKGPSPVLGKCNTVEAALGEAEDLPGTVRSMLAGMVSSSLSIMKEDRHEAQVSVVEMIGEALSGIEARMEQSVAEAKAKVDGIDEMKATREAALAEAEATLKALQEATAGSKQVLDEDRAAEAAAQSVLDEAGKAQTVGDATLVDLEKKKAKLEASKASDMAAVKEGAPEGAARKAALKSLVKIGKDFSFDGSLLEAIPSALKKALTERTGFAGVLLGQLEEEFDKHVAALAASIEQGTPAKAERAAAVAAATEALNIAKTKAEASTTALGAAKDAEKAGAAKLKAAKKSVGDYLADVKKVMDEYDEIKSQLETFTTGALAAYGELKELAPPPPPPEPEEPLAAVEEPVPAEPTEPVPMEATA